MVHYLSRLQKQITDNWNKTALADFAGKSITFGQMAAMIAKKHILFSRAGIRKGDRIAICARNQATWGETFLAINTYGAVAVPILADFHHSNIESILVHSESIMLFTDNDIWDTLDKNRLRSVANVFSVKDFSALLVSGTTAQAFDSLDQLFVQQYPNGFTSANVNYATGGGRDLAVISYTSGSTGQPKGVMLRYECFSANIEFGQKRIPSTPDDNMLSILPMAHMFGLVFELLYPLCGGTAVHYLGKSPSPTLLMKAMATVKPYLVIAVPMIFEKIYKTRLLPMMKKPSMKILTSVPFIRQIIFSKMKRAINLSFGGNVRMYIMGGAAVNPEVEAFLHKIGLHFTVGYGMTEGAPLLAYEDWDRFALRSSGKAMDFVQIRVSSEDPQNIPGEIQARGISLFSGYYRNEEATKAAFTKDGWFNTGDLGTIDSKGNIFIKGRSKSMLLTSNGQNIYPEEIECIVNSQEYAVESVVVLREDKLVALVSLDREAMKKQGIGEGAIARILESIRNGANLKLSKFSQISKIEAVDKPFEKTPKLSIKRYLYK